MCFPRARGDVPSAFLRLIAAWVFSPRTRGCSWKLVIVTLVLMVFPAHAGMFRLLQSCYRGLLRFPRARGDVPGVPRVWRVSAWFSPRTRGCSASYATKLYLEGVFPAHAGMFLYFAAWGKAPACFPRARGDVPATHVYSLGLRAVFPAHAGMFPGMFPPATPPLGFPRARGDVPPSVNTEDGKHVFSPRTRGCSPLSTDEMIAATVFPAHAGMFLKARGAFADDEGFPRARGDVPGLTDYAAACYKFSPRTRGCSSRSQTATG